MPASIAQPVPPPEASVGDDARVVGAACFAALSAANQNTKNAREWYEALRATYAKGEGK